MSVNTTTTQDMDKKSRQISVPSKGNGLESNGSNNHQKPKQGRRREGQNPPKTRNDVAQRKPLPQKYRALDKRPRARGNFNGGSRDEMMKEGEAEYGSVQAWGSKKSNLNHLLNFHFESREGFQGGVGRGGWRGPKHRGGRSKGVKYNKEQFLQANCQFIVREGQDYAVHCVDADMLVNWEFIEQVRISDHEVPSCPICLYPPVAAKLTRCGHIYCWACILHYLSLGDKTWRRCPICYEAVHQNDLKSIVASATHNYVAGEEISMKLMRRQKGTTVAMPVAQWEDRKGQLYNMNASVDKGHIKLLEANQNQVQAIIDAEKLALEQQLKEDGTDTLEGSYINAALEMLKERQSSLNGEKSVTDDIESLSCASGSPTEKMAPTEMKFQGKQNAVEYASAFSDEEEGSEAAESPGLLRTQSWCEEFGIPAVDDATSLPRVQSWSQPEHPNVTEQDMKRTPTISESSDSLNMTQNMEDLTMDDSHISLDQATEELSIPTESEEKGPQGKKGNDAFYFYQAADGQPIYIHSINARCLVREYGNLQYSPPEIRATVVEIERVSMTEELRRRLRYLNHLPLTREFQVVELALKPPVVSKDTLRFFADEIERRKKLRQRKSRDERRFARRIQERENKEMGIDPSRVIVPSMAASVMVASGAPKKEAFPVPTTESNESTPLGSPGISTENLASSPLSVGSLDDGGITSTMSFAQMLRAGKAKPQESMQKTPQSDGPRCEGSKAADNDDSDEDRVPVPMYQASFGDAIQEALDNYKKKPGDIVVEQPQSHSGGKKKKVPTATLR